MTKRDLMLTAATAIAAPMALMSPAIAQQVSIVQPGPPGAAVRVITPAEASRIANTRFTAADIGFMQMMIVHHAQAVEMAALRRRAPIIRSCSPSPAGSPHRSRTR